MKLIRNTVRTVPTPVSVPGQKLEPGTDVIFIISPSRSSETRRGRPRPANKALRGYSRRGRSGCSSSRQSHRYCTSIRGRVQLWTFVVVMLQSSFQRSLRLFQSRFLASGAACSPIVGSSEANSLRNGGNEGGTDGGSAGFVRWIVDTTEHNSRLDRFIKRKVPGLPPGFIQRLIRQGKVKVGGSPPYRNAHPVSANDVVELPGDIKLGLSRGKKKPAPDDTTLKEAEMIKSWVLHRDARCVVLNKPKGIATQGGTDIGERHVEAFLSGIGAGRYWLVHRLDKDVSGTLVVARDVGAAAIIAEYFRNRQVSKTYWALVHGKPQRPSGLITADVAGKSAVTAYRVVKSVEGHGTWLELNPKTGRKHQLRIHCANALGTPIHGDDKYLSSSFAASAAPGSRNGAAETPGLHLHARSIEFPRLTKVHASSSTKVHKDPAGTVKVEAPLPIHMQQHWASIGLLE